MARNDKAWAAFLVPFCLAITAPFVVAVVSQTGPPAEEPIAPVVAAESLDQAKTALGDSLFNDARLSHDDVIACASCHRLDLSGDDGQIRSAAADGGSLDFNSPTVFNAFLSFRLNWRGNFRSIEEQNEAVLLDHRLMNTSWEELLPKLRSDPDYAARFRALYGTAPDRTTVLDALAVFQRSLATTNARFDRYLRGERDAITADEEQGYRLFRAYGCIACHQGVNVGGNLFQKFGIFQNPFAGQESLSMADQGRLAITGDASDRHVFRVPSLRNVAVTAPYFHDGRTASLGEAVKIMARSQLGREIDQRDTDLIVKFLGTLTGEYRGRPLVSAADRLEQ